MYEYTICNMPNEEIFKKQCIALEKGVPYIKLIKTLHDVDDSMINIYEVEGNTVKVSNDYYLGGIFIESEIELEQFFR